MAFQPGDVVFVDESKARVYYLVAVAISPFLIGPTEKRLKQLRRGGRSVIHFKDEGPNRDRLIQSFTQMDVRAAVYSTQGSSDRIARPLLLSQLVDDITEAGCRRLVIERDASVEQHDRRTIGDRLSELGRLGGLEYTHRTSREQPLLWIPDAIAWCQQRGGIWRAKVGPIVEKEIRLPSKSASPARPP